MTASAIVADFASVATRWRTWTLMADQDIKMRYKRSILGPFWISIAMATTVVTIGVLYAEVFNQPYKEFLSWFGCGVLAWALVSSVMLEACTIIADNDSVLRSVNMPIPMLSARMVYRNVVIFFHNALVVGLLLVLFGLKFSALALYAIPGVILIVLFGLFVGVALGPICARFRDLAQVVASAVQVLFFVTPIFWSPKPGFSRPILIEGNPFYHFVQLVRAPMLGEAPTLVNWQVSLMAVGVAAALAMVSLAASRKSIYLWL